MQPNVVGTITSWSGSIINIPSGYALCDGTNGTPDMRNRFIPGAGDAYTPGANGGAVNHAHDFTTDGHDHILSGSGATTTVGAFDQTTDVKTDTGTTNPDSSLPPYYSLAYIMYVGGS